MCPRRGKQAAQEDAKRIQEDVRAWRPRGVDAGKAPTRAPIALSVMCLDRTGFAHSTGDGRRRWTSNLSRYQRPVNPPAVQRARRGQKRAEGAGHRREERETEEGIDAKRLHGDARASVHDEGRVTLVGHDPNAGVDARGRGGGYIRSGLHSRISAASPFSRGTELISASSNGRCCSETGGSMTTERDGVGTWSADDGVEPGISRPGGPSTLRPSAPCCGGMMRGAPGARESMPAASQEFYPGHSRTGVGSAVHHCAAPMPPSHKPPTRASHPSARGGERWDGGGDGEWKGERGCGRPDTTTRSVTMRRRVDGKARGQISCSTAGIEAEERILVHGTIARFSSGHGHGKRWKYSTATRARDEAESEA
ncbi:hypothetical protein B0H13DRAFT_2411767 [Mycena leptocephala]|nr:hypothetical protein B0H13DRAFT_2411767 [Mycena leptocephala]